MNSYQRITCSQDCARALREDTRAGLIYGPYRVPDGHSGFKFGSRIEWAAYADECVYCRAELPRGRAKRLQAIIDQSRKALAEAT